MTRCSSCYQPRSPRKVYGSSTPDVGADGSVELTTYPDCAERYAGPNAGETIYIVGWGTPNEAIFRSSLAKRASAYARSFSPELLVTQAYASQLCAEAVVDAFAAAE